MYQNNLPLCNVKLILNLNDVTHVKYFKIFLPGIQVKDFLAMSLTRYVAFPRHFDFQPDNTGFCHFCWTRDYWN